ncbi:hypothetical protein OSH11_23330 [Kaistia dalseonensis]|uniref:Uncharacterized protein n=1 Tax=Kaistia dalseonensis TaxID=410840 RepID=A0ABU0HEA7_9HYPH|nr:hypothetical protein [Kaistia dalseonensis]MCX5497650.1 hypothetical protein [Kaistia dalseonensis]MDQ0440292.1 hypothetical protein [Kaistia dalseonensis]
MSKKSASSTTAEAFVKGLGALAIFAHPLRRSESGSTASKSARALASDWDRIGADLRKVAGRERPAK